MGLFRHLQANQHLLNEQELIHLNYMMDKENFSLLKNSTLKELADRLPSLSLNISQIRFYYLIELDFFYFFSNNYCCIWLYMI